MAMMRTTSSFGAPPAPPLPPVLDPLEAVPPPPVPLVADPLELPPVIEPPPPDVGVEPSVPPQLAAVASAGSASAQRPRMVRENWRASVIPRELAMGPEGTPIGRRIR